MASILSTGVGPVEAVVELTAALTAEAIGQLLYALTTIIGSISGLGAETMLPQVA
jgi:hypothetical protein